MAHTCKSLRGLWWESLFKASLYTLLPIFFLDQDEKWSDIESWEQDEIQAPSKVLFPELKDPGKKIHNLNLTILTIFNCVVKWP